MDSEVVSPGSRVGPCEVLTPRGAGGMGEVSLARDNLRTGRKELWKEFGPQDAAGISAVGPVWATPDRRWYAYWYVRSLADLYVVEGLK